MDCVGDRKKVTPLDEKYCRKVYNNNICDEKCNSAEFGFDGQDCIKQPEFSDTAVILEIASELGLTDRSNQLERAISTNLRTSVKIIEISQASRTRRAVNQLKTSTIKFKVLKTCKSTELCFSNADRVAEFLDTEKKRSRRAINFDGFEVKSVSTGSSKSYSYVVQIASGSLLAVVLVGVVVKVRQKSIWVPTELKTVYPSSKKRKRVEPETDTIVKRQKDQNFREDSKLLITGAVTPPSDTSDTAIGPDGKNGLHLAVSSPSINLMAVQALLPQFMNRINDKTDAGETIFRFHKKMTQIFKIFCIFL